MACKNCNKDSEWPALSDVVSVTDGRHQKNLQAKSKENNSTNGHDSVKENSKKSNISIGTRNKKNNKIVWQPLQIETQPYKKKSTGRWLFDSSRRAENDKNSKSRSEFSSNSENSRGNSRNGAFKGKRGRPYSNYASFQDKESVSSETSSSCGIKINGVTFFPQTFSDATRKNFIKRQMEYYFSDTNLVSDVYLRLKMDNHGFVPLNIFLNFPRIMHLTHDINALSDAVEESNKLELSYHNYQLYVRRIVDPLGWKIRNPVINEIEIPFDDTFLNVPVSETIENLSPNDTETIPEPSNNANQTTEPANDNISIASENESCVKSDSDDLSPNKELLSVAESNSTSIVHQMESLTLNGDSSELHIEPTDVQYAQSFNEESSNPTSPATISPSECDIELSGVYIDSKAISNNCDYYSPPESVEQVDGCRFYPENVYNDIIFYDTNEVSNQGPVYYMVNSKEVLSNSSDNSSNSEVLHLSPEPSR